MHLKHGRYYYIQKLPDGKQAWRPLARELAAALNEYKRWQNASDPNIGGLDKERELKRLFRSARFRAQRNAMSFDITMQDLRDIATRSNWTCALTGIPFERSAERVKLRRPFAPSLDRVKAEEGYTKGNVRLVCIAVNFAMNEWGESIFAAIASSYVGRSSEKT